VPDGGGGGGDERAGYGEGGSLTNREGRREVQKGRGARCEETTGRGSLAGSGEKDRKKMQDQSKVKGKKVGHPYNGRGRTGQITFREASAFERRKEGREKEIFFVERERESARDAFAAVGGSFILLNRSGAKMKGRGFERQVPSGGGQSLWRERKGVITGGGYLGIFVKSPMKGLKKVMKQLPIAAWKKGCGANTEVG